MEYIRTSYRKALKVIDTCTNLDHIEGARRYINSFFKTYSDLSNFRFGPFQTYEADNLLVSMYTRLYQKLDEKQVQLEIK